MKKHNLILGIGGTGAKALQNAFCKAEDCAILPIAFDTDALFLEKLNLPNKMDLSANETLGSVLDRLDPACYSWMSFYGEEGRTRIESAELARMNIGAGGWRAKAVLAFLAFCQNEEKREALHTAIDAAFQSAEEGDTFELYAVASLAGGTGSGLLLPITLYVKKYIREKYGVRIPTAALLMSAGVFSYALLKEQLVLANANAYATIRELNAVNQTAWGNGNPDARFVIGSAGDPAIGLLFDSANPKFATPEALPFDRVYFYEKTTASDSIPVQAAIFSNVLVALCRSQILQNALQTPGDDPTRIFVGVNASGMQAGAPDAANYIGLAATADFFANRFGSFAAAAEVRLAAARRELTGKKSRGSDTKDYINTVLEAENEQFFLQNGTAFDEDDEDETATAEPEGTERFKSAYFNELLSLVDETVCPDEIEHLFKKFSKPLFPPKPRVKPKEKSNAVLKAALAYADQIEELFSQGYAAIFEAKDRLVEEIIGAVLKNGETFESPEIALVGLCRLYRFLAEKLPPASKTLTPETVGNLFYLGRFEILSQILTAQASSSGIAPRFLRSLAKGEALVKQDACEKLSIAKEILVGYVYEWLKTALLSLICKYRRLFKKVAFSAQKSAQELDMALQAANVKRCDTLTLYDATDDKYLFAKYQKEFPNEIDFFAVLGKEFYQYARENDDLLAYNGAGIVEAVKQNALKTVFASPFYTATVDRGVAEVFAFKCARNEKFAETAFSLLYHLANPALKIKKTDDGSWGDPRGEAGFLLLPAGIDPAAELPAQAANYLLCTLPVWPDEKSIGLMRETPAMPLTSLAAFNETCEEADCYRAYEQSLGFTREFATAVWYPHIIGNIEFNNPLPFLSAKKQEEYDRGVIRAFLYSLISGVYSVGSSENPKSETLYFRGSDCARLPVTIGEKVLTRNNWGLLPSWIRRRGEKMRAWDAAYCEQLTAELRVLPAVGFNGFNLPELIRAIKRSPLIRAMRENLFDQVIFFGGATRLGIFELAYWQKQTEKENGGEKLAEKLLAEGLDVIRTFCTYRIPASETESREAVAAEIKKYFLDFLRENAGDPVAKSVSAWIKKLGGF